MRLKAAEVQQPLAFSYGIRRCGDSKWTNEDIVPEVNPAGSIDYVVDSYSHTVVLGVAFLDPGDFNGIEILELCTEDYWAQTRMLLRTHPSYHEKG